MLQRGGGRHTRLVATCCAGSAPAPRRAWHAGAARASPPCALTPSSSASASEQDDDDEVASEWTAVQQGGRPPSHLGAAGRQDVMGSTLALCAQRRARRCAWSACWPTSATASARTARQASLHQGAHSTESAALLRLRCRGPLCTRVIGMHADVGQARAGAGQGRLPPQGACSTPSSLVNQRTKLPPHRAPPVHRRPCPYLQVGDKVFHEDVTLDGEPLDPPNPLHLMLHKPIGYVVTSPEDERVMDPTIYDLLPQRCADHCRCCSPAP